MIIFQLKSTKLNFKFNLNFKKERCYHCYIIQSGLKESSLTILASSGVVFVGMLQLSGFHYLRFFFWQEHYSRYGPFEQGCGFFVKERTKVKCKSKSQRTLTQKPLAQTTKGLLCLVFFFLLLLEKKGFYFTRI